MKSKTLMSISAVVVWFAAASFVYAADASLGTWKLNVAKSKYSLRAQRPRAATVTYEAVGRCSEAHRRQHCRRWQEEQP